MASQYDVSLLWIFHHKFKMNSQRTQKGTLMPILPWERHITVELILSSATANPMFSNKLLRRWSFSAYFSLWHRDLSSVYITITLFVLLCVSKLSFSWFLTATTEHRPAESQHFPGKRHQSRADSKLGHKGMVFQQLNSNLFGLRRESVR